MSASAAIPLPAMVVRGVCLEPTIPNGSSCGFSTQRPPRSGEVVCVQMLFPPFARGVKYLKHRPGFGWWFASTDGVPPIRYDAALHVIVAPLAWTEPPAVPLPAVAERLTPEDLAFRAELAELAKDALQVPVELGVEFVDTRTADETAAVARILGMTA